MGYGYRKFFTLYFRHYIEPLINPYCHGASCMQANDAEGRKTID